MTPTRVVAWPDFDRPRPAVAATQHATYAGGEGMTGNQIGLPTIRIPDMIGIRQRILT